VKIYGNAHRVPDRVLLASECPWLALESLEVNCCRALVDDICAERQDGAISNISKTNETIWCGKLKK